MQPQNGIKTWQWVVTAVVIVVIIIIGIWVFGNKGSSTPASMNAPVATTDTMSATGAINRIVMSDQYPGDVVYLNSAQFANPGWVVIDADNNGTPGAILGETYFASGINPGKISLSQPMVDGGTYYAIMYNDDGNQKFNTATDKPLTDANGNVIMKVFHASASVSSEIKG
jgi:hypothetical protein